LVDQAYRYTLERLSEMNPNPLVPTEGAVMSVE
jgi:hypothetical protein